MGWREIVSSLLLCGGALCRPSLLGAARGFPFQQNIINQRHHGHASHLHHRQGHSLEVSPLDGLYGAPAELPSYGEEELPSYGQEELPAYTSAAASGSAPSPSVAAPMMMMDPSYYFEYKSADSERTEDADSTGSITGKYGYKTAGGNDILVQYSASPQTGFVIENMDELAAALERSAAEAALVKAKPYTGETVEVEYVGPKVDSVTNTQDSSYSYAYSGTDKAQQEVADAQGNVKGSYSFKTADGQDFEVKYTSGVGGFVVDNLEELLALSNPQSAEYAAVVAEHAAIAAEQEALATEAQAVIAARSGSVSSPAAQPYIHEEIEAEPYIHEDVPYVHEEIVAEPYIHDDGSSAAANTDASYGFAYNEDSAERKESADASGLIQGSYKYTNAEGNNINVEYEAGSGIGFVIKNQDDLNAAIRKATEDGAIAAATKKAQSADSSGSSSSSASSSTAYSSSAAASSFSAAALPLPGYGDSAASAFSLPDSNAQPAYGRRRVAVRKQNVAASSQHAIAQSSGGAVMDRSFMFTAVGDDHEFMESADAAGERTGSYSYVNPDGENILVKYSAGKEGFVILNPREVLPQAHVV